MRGDPSQVQEAFATDELIEVHVDSIRVHTPTGQHVVFLKEKSSERYLPIWIGPDVANAIATRITNVKPERPMTHDLMATALRELGCQVERVVVTSVADDVYYARLYARSETRAVDVDSRPSDAIALAVRFECPLYVASEVMDHAGIIPSPDEETETAAEDRGAEPVDEDRLTVFRNLINSLDLPDFPDEPGPRSQ
ncbi:MAG: bifunctional nuclease family protein [Candidatus Dormibacteraceae bacterium]